MFAILVRTRAAGRWKDLELYQPVSVKGLRIATRAQEKHRSMLRRILEPERATLTPMDVLAGFPSRTLFGSFSVFRDRNSLRVALNLYV
jgi:hypothetical protein